MITSASNQKNPLWYKDAIIYQLHVRAFHDSNEDGIGDFQGLIQKLDYLSDLGINAIWILPFYPSPLRDDGYDIADYNGVNPQYGSLEDFQEFLHAAHHRNIRVITELVINHTSDQHEWFQKSRRAPVGSFWRNFYVWSDDPTKYRGTRIIFKDFESSNWTWDPVAKSYFWHRFYSHQPDLNFDNPEVQKAIFKAFDFWMQMGVDGMRLDAVPYLFEREHTSNENLPETHAFLKVLRAHIDQNFPGRMLLAEANQWPEDAVNYFGNGDECHMNFHFPLMPRLFMALKMEDRFSIIDILKQTPEIPENCQWATFLRNHDELTLEMVTDEERDYMYKVYAADPRARINLGVRRRLAPLVGNDRRQIELLNALLFSLPGSPIVYYGDEIGMGDNIYLGDRDGVRTPFQWSGERNAGFSRANPQKLYMPVISTPEYPAEAVNVENLKANPSSLLWWMTKLISLRSVCPELSRGKLEFLDSNNPKVLSYMRQLDTPLGAKAVVCVMNLSRNAQFVELDLSRFKGLTPLELMGQSDFQIVGEGPYPLTLAPYSFFWLQMPDLNAKAEDWLSKRPPIEFEGSPLLEVRERKNWDQLVKNLHSYLQRARWFSGKGRKISSLDWLDWIGLPFTVPTNPLGNPEKSFFCLIKVTYLEGLPEQYLLGFSHATGARAHKILTERPEIVIAETLSPGPDGREMIAGLFYDAILEKDFGKIILESFFQRPSASGLFGRMLSEFQGEKPSEIPEASLLGGEQSNSSLIFGKQFYLKFYRKIEDGENPEVEMGRFFAAQNFASTSAFLGSLAYKQNTSLYSLAVLQKVVENESDGWSLMSSQVGQIAERILTERLDQKWSPMPSLPLSEMRKLHPPEEYQAIAGYALQLARQLGVKTAEMHLALGHEDRNPAFAAEIYTPFHQRSVFQSFRNLTDKTLSQIKSARAKLDPQTQVLVDGLLAAQAEIYQKFTYMKNTAIDAARIRIHGDYHLGQTLFTGQDFCIIDFEGEPARGIGERRVKRSPLKDVAGMLRSLEYVVEFYLRKSILRDQDRTRIGICLRVWAAWAGNEFLNAYLDKMEGSGLLPKDLGQVEAVLRLFILEKALYEVGYELRSRPDWVSIPLAGVLKILGKEIQ